MPKGFEWVAVDVTDEGQLQEVYTLLTENYVEDDDNMFR
jgi:glycylpeptide N-tetradecanoyltransferase